MRDILDNAPANRLTGQFALAPLADRNIQPLGVFAGQRHDLADLLRREGGRRPTARRVAQTRGHARGGFCRQPAAAPVARRLAPDAKLLGGLFMPLPAEASRMMRARSASFCGVECARTSAFSSASWSGESWIAGAFCAGIGRSLVAREALGSMVLERSCSSTQRGIHVA